MGVDEENLEKDPLDILNEVVEEVKDLRIQVVRYDQVYTQAKQEERITRLENLVSTLGDRMDTMTKKTGEEWTLKKLVESFFSSLSKVKTSILEATEAKIGTVRINLENFFKTEMTKEKKKWKEERDDSTKDDVNVWRLKYYKKEMEKVKTEGIKLKKDANKASMSIPSKTSGFSLLLGSFINIHTIRQNPDYYWLLTLLTITMFVGTMYFIVKPFMDLRKAEKELLELQTRQGPLYVQVDQLIEDIKTACPQESTILYWKFEDFKLLAAKRKTYGKRSWSNWFLWGLFSLFSFIIPILLFIDVLINAKNPATNGGGRCCSCSQRNILNILDM